MALQLSYQKYLYEVLKSQPPVAYPVSNTRYSKNDLAVLSLVDLFIVPNSTTHDPSTIGAGQKVPNREASLTSIFKQLQYFKRVIVMGEEGYGKSTLLNYISVCLCAMELVKFQEGHGSRKRGDLLQSIADRENAQLDAFNDLIPVNISAAEFLSLHKENFSQKPDDCNFLQIIHQALCSQLKEKIEHDFISEIFEKGVMLLIDDLDLLTPDLEHFEFFNSLLHTVIDRYPSIRIIMTSQPKMVGSQEKALDGFKEVHLASFSREQVRQYIDQWYSAPWLNPNTSSKTIRRRKQLEAMIQTQDQLPEIVTLPLSLHLLMVHSLWGKTVIPQNKEQLLVETYDYLLDRWINQNDRHLSGSEHIKVSFSTSLKISPNELRKQLYKIAFQDYINNPSRNAIEGASIKSAYFNKTSHLDIAKERLIIEIDKRAGLVSLANNGDYFFTYPKFKRYLAACHLSYKNQLSKLFGLIHSEPDQWDEVVLLAGMKVINRSKKEGLDFIKKLCDYAERDSSVDLARQVLYLNAGKLISNRYRSGKYCLNQKNNSMMLEGLIRMMRLGHLPTKYRIQAGNLLAHLGDPRFKKSAWYLPDEPLLGFIEIQEGSFVMGIPEEDIPGLVKKFGFGPDWEGKEQPISIMYQWYEREKPQHIHPLNKYYISRYLVTVAQFREFIRETGYNLEYPESLSRLDNYPVWNTTFKDALSYCSWLDERLRDWRFAPPLIHELLSSQDWHITIPSEAEWEKAARGPYITGRQPRTYPWGDDFDPDCGNLFETGVGTPSSVGCFSKGASYYGLLDMSGNTWEWTRSLWGKDPDLPEYGYPYNPTDGRENLLPGEYFELRTLRGASCNNYQRYARCTTRRAPIPVYRSSLRSFRLAIVKKSS